MVVLFSAAPALCAVSDYAGTYSGNWYSDDGYSGGFSGSKSSDSTGDDDGGSSSSGPCFIQMIAE